METIEVNRKLEICVDTFALLLEQQQVHGSGIILSERCFFVCHKSQLVLCHY